MEILIYSIFFVLNVITFGLYGWDKHQAHYGGWRIPEMVLLLLAVIGGAYGAGMGMLLFRHKTRHLSFCIVVPIALFVWLIVWALLCFISSPQ